MPFIWMIPPLAAFTIVPDLPDRSFLTTPGEASYIAVCLEILPQGMVGLLIVCMFSATMSSMDVALNKNAGFFVKNFYQPILRPRADDRELLFAGRCSTVFFGLFVTGCALLVTTQSGVSLFDAFLYLGGYLGVPLAIPLLFGMIMRQVPSWSGWSTTVFGILITILIFNFAPSAAGKSFFLPWLGDTLYGYVVSNKFVVGNLVGAPLTALFFWSTRFFYKAPQSGVPTSGDAAEFFRRMDKPIDFEAEVGDDNTARQALAIGRLTIAFGAFILLLVLIPNPLAGRLSIAGCALFPLVIGAALINYARRHAKAES